MTLASRGQALLHRAQARVITFEPESRRYRRYHRLDDQQWRKVLMDSVGGNAALPMPGFPPAPVQSSFIGSANRHAIEGAWHYYALLTDTRRSLGVDLGPESRVLDFGCGWGRHARMFLRDVPGSRIWLADTLDLALDACRDTGVPGHRVKLPPAPPSELPSSFFDLVSAFSVFSHLSPDAHHAWAGELARVLKSGALAFVTTQARWFLDRCDEYREHPELRTSVWHEQLAVSFSEGGAAEAYDRGEFLYSATGGADQDGASYGEAVVPRAVFEGWKGFELLDFITDRQRCEQAVAVLQRQ